jgi:subtilisin family serine protease
MLRASSVGKNAAIDWNRACTSSDRGHGPMQRPHDNNSANHFQRSSDKRNQPARARRYETYEDRLALSAQSPVADFWIASDDRQIETHQLPTTQVSDARGWTDLASARANYGLTGSGQTVVVIDSGIAYDHMALGGGYGSNYRVVGGWDFAENDANPYDDGPGGYHGTHVAGIIGAKDSRFSGVATGVDLVALRVFDDQGNGYFSWVEQALQWVHQNKDSFENKITTVNLSLGTEWNSATLPQWATLEDELRQLELDGIFISVSAGNSFQTYQQVGLSYPAVSQYVVPVASVGSNGMLSAFSQRDSRVIAAPGERINSTLPDHFYGGDGYKNDWGAASGTSMAAPYVAGASTLVREAMQSVGYVGITQDQIYDTMFSSADVVFDAATGQSYRRLNISRAIESVLGKDEFGNNTSAATSLGTLTHSITTTGIIQNLSDKDFLSFTAAQTGTVSFRFSTIGDVSPQWHGAASGSANTFTIQVVAGQTYSIGLGTTDGIGKYSLSATLTPVAGSGNSGGSGGSSNGGSTGGESGSSNGGSANGGSSGGANSGIPTNATNWGTVDQASYQNLTSASGGTWYQVTTSRTGRLTIAADFQHQAGNVDLELYDSNGKLVASSRSLASTERIDFDAAAGTRFYVRMVGANSDVDVKVTNLVTIAGNSVVISGTSGNDSVFYSAATSQAIVNGTSYQIGSATDIRIDGGAGTDTLTLAGSSQLVEEVRLTASGATLKSNKLRLTASGFETQQAMGQKQDRVIFEDSSGDDLFESTPQWSRMTMKGRINSASDFGIVIAGASGGYDNAVLVGSTGSDSLVATPSVATLQTAAHTAQTWGFETVVVRAVAGGNDKATVQDSTGTDWLEVNGQSTSLRGTGYSLAIENFATATFTSQGGNDFVSFNGTAGIDRFSVQGAWRSMTTATGAFTNVSGFESTTIRGGGGQDHVDIRDVLGTDFLYGRGSYAHFASGWYATEIHEVESILASVRSGHKAKTDLQSLDFYFQRIGGR